MRPDRSPRPAPQADKVEEKWLALDKSAWCALPAVPEGPATRVTWPGRPTLRDRCSSEPLRLRGTVDADAVPSLLTALEACLRKYLLAPTTKQPPNEIVASLAAIANLMRCWEQRATGGAFATSGVYVHVYLKLVYIPELDVSLPAVFTYVGSAGGELGLLHRLGGSTGSHFAGSLGAEPLTARLAQTIWSDPRSVRSTDELRTQMGPVWAVKLDPADRAARQLLLGSFFAFQVC